ncbi:MAG TPA: NAD-dependent epimerase/dehydratase family protein [Cytophagaceae bacterium]|nr:NAD-dependent epimerase/dehydratase family protein [Cytophagaceae bacterium]
MKILITGGCGFVGSSMAISIKKKYPSYEVIAFDNLKRRGSELNIPRLKAAGIQFIHGDIRNKEDFDVFTEKLDVILEASAEPSVLAGINSTPDYLVNTNLTGTINCLYLAQKHKANFIFLSTSRIYPIENIEKAAFTETATRFSFAEKQPQPGISEKGIAEQFPLEGYRSLYGATKLASELMIHEFNHFYGIKTVINRCGVLTGPWQMGKVDQGVMVLWVARHFWKKNLSYIGYGGKGKQARDVLHVDDLFRLIDHQMHNMEKVNGEIYNVGGGNEISVSLQELTAICEKVTGNKISIQEVSENRQADIRIYVTDNTKVTAATGWKPEISVEKIVEDIYQWLKTNENQLNDILN